MLTIRTEQMRAMTFPVSRALLLERAHAMHESAARALGEAGLEDAVVQVVRRCEEYRLETTADHLRILDLSMVFGADWRRPDLRWLDEGMRDERVPDPSLRLRKVWRMALRRLSRSE